MKNLMKKLDNQIPCTGQTIIRDLSKVIIQIRNLESFCIDNAYALRKCEDSLMCIAVEVASVCTNDASWDKIVKFIRDGGLELPSDVEEDFGSEDDTPAK